MSYSKDGLVYSCGYIGDKDGWLGDVKREGFNSRIRLRRNMNVKYPHL